MRFPRFQFTIRHSTIALVVLVCLIVATIAFWRRPTNIVDRTVAERQEAVVRRLVKDAPLANLILSSPTGFGWSVGQRDQALQQINPIHPKTGLTKSAGPTIDTCRATFGGLPAELLLRTGVPIADLTQLGTYTSRSMGDVGKLKNIEFLTYGNLDVGIKNGAIVVIRVR